MAWVANCVEVAKEPMFEALSLSEFSQLLQVHRNEFIYEYPDPVGLRRHVLGQITVNTGLVGSL